MGIACQKIGWSDEELAARVRVQVKTQGKDGVTVRVRGEEPIHVGAAREVRKADPTGVGDAFRAGFLAALAWGLSLEHAAEVGCVLAAYVVETVGPQDYTFTAEQFLGRLDASYGGEAAEVVRPHLAALK